MNHCEAIREMMGRWLDGELSLTDGETVRLHVASCADCGAVHRQLAKLETTLKRALVDDPAPVEFLPFWRGVQQRINEKRPWHEELRERIDGFLTAPRIAWGVPVVIVLLLGVWSLDSYLPGWRFGGARNSFASVESIDGHGRSVALLRENETKTTVIWLYQNEEGENETAEEPAKSGPAF
ncbi:MAG TPA: zf-HC2 domain-containing protein [Candidatus Binatus sp.]|nr:zf-HC2 domain-containing protein [Candidatus Binatus sp.]